MQSPDGEYCVNILICPWDFVGVISCDFVDRFSRSVTGDPPNHTKLHEQETDGSPRFDKSLGSGWILRFYGKAITGSRQSNEEPPLRHF